PPVVSTDGWHGWLSTIRSHQGEEYLVDDFDEDAVRNRGHAVEHVFVAEQVDRDGRRARRQSVGADLASRGGAAQDGQPWDGRSSADMFPDLSNRLRVISCTCQQFA